MNTKKKNTFGSLDGALGSDAEFKLGRLVATSNAITAISPDDAAGGLHRHVSGDWGECCAEDKAANDEALKTGGRLMSVYTDSKGTKFRIITEPDRSATTVLLPEDY